jgi:hypothetical protein
MPRFLCLSLLFLVACTFVSEPIEVTRIPAATAMPATATATVLSPITVTPTVTPIKATPVPLITPTILPTATPTSIPTETPTPIVMSDDIAGWLLYENSFFNYHFSYPPTATISVAGVNGFANEDIPTGMTANAFMQQLEETLPDDICVGLTYETGFVSFLPPWEKGGKFSAPCSGAGIGAYDIITVTQALMVDGQPYTAQGYQARERNEAATWVAEFYSMQLDDGTNIQYGSFQGGHTQYALIEGTLRQIVESFHENVPSSLTTAVYPSISLTETISFTQTEHGYKVQYPVGLHLLSDAVESDSYFATQPDAGSPLDLSLADFWVTVSKEDNPEGLSLSQRVAMHAKLGEEISLIVANEPAIQMSGDLRAAGDTHNGFAIITFVVHDGQIYSFTGLAYTADALNYFTPAYQLMLDTFRFLP